MKFPRKKNDNKKGIKNKIKGKIKRKTIASVVTVFLIKIIPLLLITSLVVSAISLVVELFQSKNNPDNIYSNIKSDDKQLNDIIALSGNETDGYYIGFTEKFDEIVKKTSEDFKKIGYKDMDPDLIVKLLKAELYTQYPNLGGKIGNEISVPEEENKEENKINNKVNSLENFLFVGDSITVGMDKYIEEKHNTFAENDVGAKYWLDILNKKDNGFPDQNQVKGINVFLGANDYDYGIDFMKELLKLLHKKYPNVKIFVDKLLPDKNADNATREKYINEVKRFCEKNNDFFIFIDPTKDVKMAPDGLHPSEEGYKKLAKNIKDVILEKGSRR